MRWATMLSSFDIHFYFINFKKWIYSIIFHQFTYLKKTSLKLKNNLSQSNKKLRDITTKQNYDNQVHLKIVFKKSHNTLFTLLYSLKIIYKMSWDKK